MLTSSASVIWETSARRSAPLSVPTPQPEAALPADALTTVEATSARHTDNDSSSRRTRRDGGGN